MLCCPGLSRVRLSQMLALMLILAACGTPAPTSPPPASPAASSAAPVLTSDFDPPVGAAPGAPAESPGAFRLLTAFSPDGRTFTRTGRVVSDQANVPDLILGANGLIYLYYAGWEVGGRPNTIGAALSADGGKTWFHKRVTFAGPRANAPAGDPDIVRLADGTFRLFFTAGDADTIQIWYADSADGLHFNEPQPALRRPDQPALDSTTFQLGDAWHMLILDPSKPIQWYAASPDGAHFAVSQQPSVTADGEPYLLSNGYAITGGYRMFGFAYKRAFRTFVTQDGLTWQVEPGEALTVDPQAAGETSEIKDPAVLPLPGGAYLMVYVTRLTP